MLLLFQIYRSNIITPNCYTSEAAPGSWRPPETGEMETQHRTIIGYCTGTSSFYTCYLTILTLPMTRKLPMQGHKGFLRWANTIVSCCMVPSAILWQAAVWGEEENDEIKTVIWCHTDILSIQDPVQTQQIFYERGSNINECLNPTHQ